MTKNETYFINPYHFIPIPKRKQKAYSSQGEQKYTGKLAYVLTTKTPLFIPNTSNDQTFAPQEGDAAEHQSFDFFSYHNLDEKKYYDNIYFSPVIPGSEIRGMLRSHYETLTDSCMSAIQDKEEVMSKRTMEYGSAGLLTYEGNQLVLYPAKSYSYYGGAEGKFDMFYKDCPLAEGSKVTFSIVKKKDGRSTLKAKNVKVWNEKSTSLNIGYLIKGNHGISEEITPDTHPKKRPKYNCHIFRQDWNKACIQISEVDKKRFCDVLDSYRKQDEEAYKEYRTLAERFFEKKVEYLPVYYSRLTEQNKPVYISPACVSRECYVNGIQNLIGDLKPCDGKQAICPACDLFGMLGASNEFSRNSRIRFTDALPVETKENLADYYTEPTTIPALGQPKLSNTEFYLKWKENANLMTFDYYINDKGQVIEQKPEIAGRKFYWHNLIKKLPEAAEPTQEEKKKGVKTKRSKLNRTIRAVVPETQFKGYVYFDKITEKQLKQIVWLLNFSQNEMQHGYKLGMGKPLGLGSITLQIEPEDCCLRQLEVSQEKVTFNLRQKPLNGKYQFSYQEAGFSETVQKEFLFMTDLHSTDGWTVSYPYCNPEEGADKGYEWYSQNHQGLKATAPRKRREMVTLEHLKGFEEINKEVYDIADFKLPTRPGNAFTCFWKAKYSLNSAQEKKLKELLGVSSLNVIQDRSDWIRIGEVETLSKQYEMIALPAGTKKDLLEVVKLHFDQVWIALSNRDGRDAGWKKVK